MQTIATTADRWAYVIGPYSEPVARVRPGETFVVETTDAFGSPQPALRQRLIND